MVVGSVASTSTAKAENWPEVILEPYVCDRAPQTAVVEGSTLLVKEYGWGRSCCRSSCLGAPWREMWEVNFKGTKALRNHKVGYTTAARGLYQSRLYVQELGARFTQRVL